MASPAFSEIPPMVKPELIDPYHPRTREYLHEMVRSLTEEGTPLIKIVKRAARGIKDKHGGVLGVLPASFNPPTAAHEALVSEAGAAVAFDEILLVQDQQAMDKEFHGAALEDRLLMLLALFGADKRISLGIATRGLFLDKVKALKGIYPKNTQTYFIVGYDTIVRVLDPAYYTDRKESLRALFSQARFLVANRGSCGEQDLIRLFTHKANRPFAAQVFSLTLSAEQAGISSSEVRQRLAEGRSVRGLVPLKLEEFLRTRGFYSRQGT